MGMIYSIELQSSIEYFTAVFIGSDGEVYDFVFCRSIERNIAFEDNELLNIQNRGKEVDNEDIWKEIREDLSEVLSKASSSEGIKFSVEIGREDLATLDSLIRLVLESSTSSPEEALEASIFSQISEQRKKRCY